MLSHYNSMPEGELLAQVANGNEKAFEWLVNRFSDILGAYIFRLTHSREITEEIVQDVFLKIWNARQMLPGVGNFHAWLYVVSKNQAISALRKAIRERAGKELITHNLWDQDDNSWEDEKLSAIEKAIAQLPPQQKKVFTLSRHDGLSYKEIAEQMHLSTETVKKYLQIATQSIISEVSGVATVGLFLAVIKNL
ncbi:sigma-70 family RNA polymerase sigma factor [Chitinophaga sp. 212800010-3]|uniref:RNA polymerase sigma factor n=1 Tax=unclassified Chitinophaga TaxID=2619133 RepID=UPI002DF5977B|nr:sigma-70 family RNA polymerase sigma factor [Chitinophaga sp. 212800010-3]